VEAGEIQEKSMRCENLIDSGAGPIIDFNTFLSMTVSPTVIPEKIISSKKLEINQNPAFLVTDAFLWVGAEKPSHPSAGGVYNRRKYFPSTDRRGSLCFFKNIHLWIVCCRRSR